MILDHEKERSKRDWRTQTGQHILIQDLSDSHLANVIVHLNSRLPRPADLAIIELMEMEAIYRHNNDIHVPNYPLTPVRSAFQWGTAGAMESGPF